jgi:hypothetical protein
MSRRSCLAPWDSRDRRGRDVGSEYADCSSYFETINHVIKFHPIDRESGDEWDSLYVPEHMAAYLFF